MPKEKVKVGFFSLTCCEGCEFAIIELEEKLLQALDLIEIVESRVLLEKLKPGSGRLDIAFVEGCVITSHDREKLQYIREKSSFLVAMGACAATAGVPGIRNSMPLGLQEKAMRQSLKPVLEKAFPLSAFTKVDYILNGCAVNHLEFIDFVNHFLHGVMPKLHDVPVCFECKLLENSCLLLKGTACLGPATFAGCGALCPSHNAQCIGCRGFTKDGNFRQLDKLFKEQGLSKKERRNLFTFFNPIPKELESEFSEEP